MDELLLLKLSDSSKCEAWEVAANTFPRYAWGPQTSSVVLTSCPLESSGEGTFWKMLMPGFHPPRPIETAPLEMNPRHVDSDVH